MFNELESKYEGMIDGVYEGWFIVLYQDETKARVMWSSMKDEENVVSIVIEDWEKFADGTWGAFNVVADSLGYEYTKEKDIYYYSNFKRIYCEVVNEEEINVDELPLKVTEANGYLIEDIDYDRMNKEVK